MAVAVNNISNGDKSWITPCRQADLVLSSASLYLKGWKNRTPAFKRNSLIDWNREGGNIMWFGRASIVCLSYLYIWSARGRKFCWMALCDWPLWLTSSACGVGGQKRNQICSIEHSTSLSGIMFFSVWTWKIRSIVCFDWKQRTHPAVRSTCTHCGMSFHHIRHREKCYIHSTAKICNWGNSHTVRNHDSEFGCTLMFKFTNIL